MAEVLIPSLHKLEPMISHRLFNPRDLDARESATALQPNWVEPEFCNPIVTLNVDVLRFVAVTRVKEEAIRAGPQYCLTPPQIHQYASHPPKRRLKFLFAQPPESSAAT